jgi:alanine-synthesizing transaminase
MIQKPDHEFVRLSDRMSRLPPYIFGTINRIKLKKRQEGIDVIDMAMGNPTDPTPQPIVDKLCEVVQDPRSHRYSAAAGLENLRREIALFYEEHYQVELDPGREVIATIGSKEGFAHLCLALIGPGDTAIVPSPSYPIHSYGVILAGGNDLGLEVTPDESFLRLVDETCRNYFPPPKVLFLNYPHNPSAHVVDIDFFDQVVALARKHGLIVVHDLAYGGIAFEGYQPPSFLQARGATQVGVEFTTMSKTFNMAGWRIGFCSGNRQIIDGLRRIKGYYDYGIFQAIQIASIIGIRDYERISKEQSQIYQERRDALIQGLRLGGWNNYEVPRAGMFLWARLPEGLEGMDSTEFCRGMLDEAEVAMAPGAAFGADGEGFVRLALIENKQRIQQAARQIRRVLTRWQSA